MIPSHYPVGSRVLVHQNHRELNYKSMVAFTVIEWSTASLYVKGKQDHDGTPQWYEASRLEVLDSLPA